MLPCSISLCREMPPVLSDLEKQEGVCAKEYLYNLVHDESCFQKFVSSEVVTSPVTVLMPRNVVVSECFKSFCHCIVCESYKCLLVVPAILP